MTSRSTGKLTGSELDQERSWFEVRTELIHPIPGPIEKLGYILVNIPV